MSDVLADFVRALRASNVRVSTSEIVDAQDAIAAVGYEDRATLKFALGQVLAKSEEEKDSFSYVFDRYFEFQSFTDRKPERDASDQEENEDSEEDQGEADGGPGEEGQGGEGEGGQGQGGAQGPTAGGNEVDNEVGGTDEESGGAETGGPRDLVSLLDADDQAALQMALAQSARNVGLNRIRLFTQRGLYTRRILDDMGMDQVSDAIIAAEERGDVQGEARTEDLRSKREGLREQVRDYVEKQLEIYTANAGEQLREEVLSSVKLTNVERSDMRILRQLVRKMAKRLISLYSRRRKVDQRGVLDIRKTIRANIEFDGLLFKTVWKQKKVDRPRVSKTSLNSGRAAPGSATASATRSAWARRMSMRLRLRFTSILPRMTSARRVLPPWSAGGSTHPGGFSRGMSGCLLRSPR